MLYKNAVLHPLYGMGILKVLDPNKKRAFIRFIDREYWGNHKVIGGWFNLQEVSIPDFILVGDR